MRLLRMCFVLAATLLSLAASAATFAADPVKVGIVGTDNYQGLAFTQIFHKPPADNPDVGGLQVVSFVQLPNPDLEDSEKEAQMWADRLVKLGATEKETVAATLDGVDAAMLMTLDGRTHLELAEQILAAGKPLYIGRPMVASLEDCLAIFALSEKYDTPVFSCSQHRYSPGFIGMRNHPEVGKVMGCEVYGGCPTLPHHSYFMWHAVHSFETLFTIMRPGVETVTCTHTDDFDLVTGVWKDGRIGTYRGIRNGALKYSALVFGDKGIAPAGIYGYAAPVNGVVPKGRYKGYEGVSTEIAKFFKSGKLPIEPSETIELFAFMEAAEQSRQQGGVPIKIADVLAAAKKKLAEQK